MAIGLYKEGTLLPSGRDGGDATAGGGTFTATGFGGTSIAGAAVVVCANATATPLTDVTYAGSAMTRVGTAIDTTEAGWVGIYTLTGGAAVVPDDANPSVVLSGRTSASKIAQLWTFTATTETVVGGTTLSSGSGSQRNISITKTNGRSGWAVGGMHDGNAEPPQTSGGAYTAVLGMQAGTADNWVDYGTRSAEICASGAAVTASTAVIGWTTAVSEDWCFAGVVIEDYRAYSFEQTHFRFRDDTVGLNVDTWAIGATSMALDESPTIDAADSDVTVRVRFEVEEDAGAEPAPFVSADFAPYGTLAYSLNGGAWTNITQLSSVVRETSSTQYDGNVDKTTDVLSGSSLPFVQGGAYEYDGVVWRDTYSDPMSNAHTELEHCIKLMSADLANGDEVRLRVRCCADRETALPTITIGAGGITNTDRPIGTLSLSAARVESHSWTAQRSGTLTLSGTRRQSYETTRRASGQVTLSGAVRESWGLSRTDRTSGAITLSGAVRTTRSHSTRPTGTLVVSGARRESALVSKQALGTLTLSGAVRESHALVFTNRVTGTLSLSGARRESLAGSELRSGTFTLAGAVSESHAVAFTDRVSGTISLSGASRSSHEFADSRTGTITLSGGASDEYTLGGVANTDRVTGTITLSVGAAAFGPTSITGCELWLDASQIVGLNDDDVVATWEDASGVNHDATSATGQTYQTNEQNGLPIVRFDGSDDYLQVAGITNNDPNRTIFFVCKRTGFNFEDRAWGFVTDASLRVGYSGGFAYSDDSGGNPVAIGSPDTVWSLVTVKWTNSGSASVYYNDAAATATFDPNDWFSLNTGAAFTIGAANASVRFFAGDIAEVLMYDSALSDGDRANVVNYLGYKWGLGFGAPPGGGVGDSNSHTAKCSGVISLSGARQESALVSKQATGTITLNGGVSDQYTLGGTENTDRTTGTITLAGAVSASLEAADKASGVVTLSGAIRESQSAADQVTGTIVLSGAVRESQSLERTDRVTGTISLAGSVRESLAKADSATGTISLSGTIRQSQTGTVWATGTITLSGQATDSWNVYGGEQTVSVSGSIVLSGSVTDAQARTVRTSGQITLSGAIRESWGKTFVDTCSGVLTLSGTERESASHTAFVTGVIVLSGSVRESHAGTLTDSVTGTIVLSGRVRDSWTYGGFVFDTHPDLAGEFEEAPKGGDVAEPALGALFDESLTSGAVTESARDALAVNLRGAVLVEPSLGGVVQEPILGGVVQEPLLGADVGSIRSGSHDESLTGGTYDDGLVSGLFDEEDTGADEDGVRSGDVDEPELGGERDESLTGAFVY